MEKQKDLKEIQQLVKQLIRRRGKMFLAVCLPLLFLTLVTAFVLPPMYVARAKILVESQKIPQEYVLTSVTSYVEERLSIITQQIMSRAKLLGIINQFNLYADMRQHYATEEVVGSMREDIQLETISTSSLGKGSGKGAGTTIAFTLSYSGKDPATVQKVTNVLASLYLEENLKKRSERAAGTTEFLASQLNEVKKQMDDYSSKLSAMKSTNAGALPEQSAANMQAVERLTNELSTINAQIRSAQERRVFLESQIVSVDQSLPGPANVTELNPADRLDTLRNDLVNRKTTLSDKHPDIIRLKREINELEQQLDESRNSCGRRNASGGQRNVNPAYTALKAQIETAGMEIRSLQQQIGQVKSQLAGYQDRITQSPMIEGDYKTLVTDYESAKAKYNDILYKLMESKIAQQMEETQQAERFTLVEPAPLPEKPEKPNRPKILLMGLFLSLFAGGGLVFAQESLDRSIKTEADLSALASVPVLSVIPFMSNGEPKSRYLDLILNMDRKKLMILAASIGAAAVLFFLLIHLFLMPLDILWLKIVRKILLNF